MTVARRATRAALLGAVAALALGVAPPRARAADGPRVREARAHYEQAVANYNLDEFGPALAEFREAYRLKPDPSFLFNIAQCHRRLGENEAALDYYRKYLRNLPDAPNREDVQRMIADLRAKTSSQPAAAAPVEAATPTLAPAVVPGPSAVAPPVPSLDAPAPGAEAPLVVTAPAPPPARPPVYERWWFWSAIGAAVVGVVVIAVVASSSGPQPYMGNLGPDISFGAK